MMPERFLWNVLLLTAGLAYVLIVLSDYAASPAFAIIFVALATQEMVRSHRKRH
jgi:hypothetical protein